jgi:hypothetical protein
MSVPGFTANSSLGPATKFYASSKLAYTSSNANRVSPQVQFLYAFWDEEGCLCKGIEDYDRGISYVKGCIC